MIHTVMADTLCTKCGNPMPPDRLTCVKCGHIQLERTVYKAEEILVPLSKARRIDRKRILTGLCDEVFGGGLVDTSVTLIAGEPGAGKSTLSLQLAGSIVQLMKRPIVYIGAEEAPEDILDRAERLGLPPDVIDQILSFPLGCEADVVSVVRDSGGCAVFLDSLQGLTKDLIEQVELCKNFKRLSMELRAPTLIMCQVTKDLDAAGLKALQHEVDTDLRFTTFDHNQRELQPMKNRFGNTDVLLELLMTDKGLVRDPGATQEEEDDDE